MLVRFIMDPAVFLECFISLLSLHTIYITQFTIHLAIRGKNNQYIIYIISFNNNVPNNRNWYQYIYTYTFLHIYTYNVKHGWHRITSVNSDTINSSYMDKTDWFLNIVKLPLITIKYVRHNICKYIRIWHAAYRSAMIDMVNADSELCLCIPFIFSSVHIHRFSAFFCSWLLLTITQWNT